MKFKLSTILESTVLLEGRKEDVIKKFGDENSEIINTLSSNDPSGNNKYLSWMAKMVLVVGENQNHIVRVTNEFHEQLPRIKEKDINTYKSYSEIKKIVDEALIKSEEKAAEKEADKVFEDDTVVIYAPLTVRASCKYGSGSKWCITSKSGDEPNVTYNTYYDSYSKDAVFYFFLRKGINKESDPKGYKWALQYAHNGSLTWWDAQDQSQNAEPTFVTTKMMRAVNEYNKSAVANKLERQIKSFITQPTINKYKDYREHLTQKQIDRVIGTIIRGGDLNSNTFKILVADLSDEQKEDFISTYVVGKVTATDYKAMNDHLNDKQILKLISNNPTILNNSEIIKSLDDMYDDNEKYELSKTIIGKSITNTDSKVLIKKWSMSPEEREKHKQSSFYVFLSDEEKYIKNFIEVNPLDPNSYRTINMLKLNKSLKPGTSLYGIKSPYGKFSDYVDKSSNDINVDVLADIRQGARKIE